VESLSLYREVEKNVKIVFHDSNEVPPMKVDREQMKRVMINLLDNAMDAVSGDGEIKIDLSVEQDQQAVKIEVSDTGKGIPPEYKSRVFEPYFSTKKHGTGLGLAIVSTIISDHNGSIRVEDVKPRGTKFVIVLPARV
jgi:two-component system nitrogen regulation sensor histidine kinase NtrY